MTDLTIITPATADGSPYQIPEDGQQHFINTVNKALWHLESSVSASVSISLNHRSKPKRDTHGNVYDRGGWLEHVILITYSNTNKLLIGAVQREVGAESEFHS